MDGDVARAPGRPLRRGEHVAALVEPELLRSRARVARPALRPVAGADPVRRRDPARGRQAGRPAHARDGRSHASEPRGTRRGTGSARGEGRRPWPCTSGSTATPPASSLFGIDARANAGLATAFASHQAVKTYLALTAAPQRRLPRRFRIEDPIGTAGPGGEGCASAAADAKAAQTDVLVREVLRGALLVEARPLTGRRHQLRAHLAHAGVPVLGDAVYGGHGPERAAAHAPRLAPGPAASDNGPAAA